ncbi:MAG TPA: hypothetical protein VGE76_22630 [Opitutaceae bacterium]
MPLRRTLLLLVSLAPALAQPPATETPAKSEAAPTTPRDPDGTSAASNPISLEKQLRQNRIAQEVAIRRAIREIQSESEPPSDPEVARAIGLIRDQNSGKKDASAQDLQAAQARLRRYAENTPAVRAITDEVTRLERLATPEQLKAAAMPDRRETDPDRLKRIGEIVAARRVIREHETGTKLASAAELEAAENTLLNYDRGNSSTLEGVKKEAARLELVAAEVARRRELREQAATSGAAAKAPTKDAVDPK